MSDDKMREAFEEWCLYKHFHPTANTQFEWDAWQAATASMQKELAELQALVKVKDEALTAAEKCINILWVSHHANRGDAALHKIQQALAQTSGTEALDKLIAEADQRGYAKAWGMYPSALMRKRRLGNGTAQKSGQATSKG